MKGITATDPTRLYVFADEAGDLKFNRKGNTSRYFTLTTIAMTSCNISHELLDLRRRLAFEGAPLLRQFHATEDKQAVRDEVINVIKPVALRIDVTLFDKPKIYPHIAANEFYVYQWAWFYHLRYVYPSLAKMADQILIIAAALGSANTARRYEQSFESAVIQIVDSETTRHAFWPAISEPCLQVADYCSWAIQRKWERSDSRAYDVIRNRIVTEYDFLQPSSRTFY